MSSTQKGARILAATGMLVAVTASPVWAGVPVLWGFTEVCGGNNFETCASGSLWAEQSGENTIVHIQVTNLGMASSVFKAVGLINIPAGADVAFTGGSAFAAGWTGEPPQDLSGGGLPEGTYGAIASNPAPEQGLDVGETHTYAFTFYGGLTEQQIDALGIGVHGISGPNGCSTKLGILPDGQGGGEAVLQGPYDPDCVPVNVVPEPITMALLGTGLAGIAGVAHRRRRQDEVEEEAA